jgi:hypothetical protein
MSCERFLDKPAPTGRELPPDRHPALQQPQIPSPLASDGPELMRDTHC